MSEAVDLITKIYRALFGLAMIQSLQMLVLLIITAKIKEG